MSNVPFNKSSTVGKELQFITESLLQGQIAGDQLFTKKCQELLKHVTGSQRALLTTSCTHALEMSALLLDIKPGDEVIVPSFTFVSTVNAFILRGAKPIFIDSRHDTLNLDEKLLERLITIKTKAILPVHYAGVSCEMDTILQIANQRKIAVIEDNAHGLFGKYKGHPLGSLGVMATQSFHETKNITCGEGGALLINDSSLIERAEIIREKGTNRSKFFRGQIDKYTWVDVGSSYVVSDVLAAFLFGQLEQYEQIQQRRKKIWETYDSELKPWASKTGIRRPTIPDYCEQAYHMYYLLMPDVEKRQRFIGHLKEFGINAVFHYQPLHLSPMGMKFGGKLGDCKVAEKAGDCLVRLPFFNSMTDENAERVIEMTKKFLK
jgi:dTDP-4-amino-4,6-dideoxygalactose transaminase